MLVLIYKILEGTIIRRPNNLIIDTDDDDLIIDTDDDDLIIDTDNDELKGLTQGDPVWGRLPVEPEADPAEHHNEDTGDVHLDIDCLIHW